MGGCASPSPRTFALSFAMSRPTPVEERVTVESLLKYKSSSLSGEFGTRVCFCACAIGKVMDGLVPQPKMIFEPSNDNISMTFDLQLVL